jgi:probable addiction module antidote protein
MDEFLYALRDVAIAHGGMQEIAEKSHHGRESLYKALSKEGNPRIKTLNDILHAMGMRIAVTRERATQKNDEKSDSAVAYA